MLSGPARLEKPCHGLKGGGAASGSRRRGAGIGDGSGVGDAEKSFPAEQVEHAPDCGAGILEGESASLGGGGEPAAQVGEGLNGFAVDVLDPAEIQGNGIDGLIEVAQEFTLQCCGMGGAEDGSVELDEQLASGGVELDGGGHAENESIRRNKYQKP